VDRPENGGSGGKDNEPQSANTGRDNHSGSNKPIFLFGVDLFDEYNRVLDQHA